MYGLSGVIFLDFELSVLRRVKTWSGFRVTGVYKNELKSFHAGSSRWYCKRTFFSGPVQTGFDYPVVGTKESAL